MPCTYADNNVFEVNILLSDQDAQSLKDHLATVRIETGQEAILEEKYIGDDSLLTLSLSNGSYDVGISIRSLTDETKYYYNTLKLDVNQNQNLSFKVYKVAHIVGIVLDEYDNLVIYANLNFQCSQTTGTEFPAKTDTVGSFRAANLLLGKCRVFASSEDHAGFVDINLTQNRLYDITLRMDKKTTAQDKSSFPAWLLFLLVLIVLIILVVLIIVVREKKKRPNQEITVEQEATVAKDEPDQQKIVVNQRMQDIMKTLNDNETDVVKFLCDNNGTATQSKIRQFTGIPKTSLFRCINSLESKNLVKTESIGKMKTIELTGFFCSGNENKGD